MDFLAFLFLVWLLLAGLAYAVWMLRDAWKKGRPTTGPSKRPWFWRLFPAGEIAWQVIAALGVCAVVAYALHSILRDESFQGARELTVSWVTSRNPNQRLDEQFNGRIPAGLLCHDLSRPGRPVCTANVGGLPISDEDLEWMVQTYPDLDAIILTRTKVTDAGLASLTRWKNLQTLVLNRVRLTDNGLAKLATLTKLRELHLSNCRISDAGIAHLRSLGNLRELYLAGTQVTDAGLASLASMTELEKLDLSRTAITEAGLRHLEKLPKLRIVHLDETAIPPEVRARFYDR